jgi:hypothetical protein
MASKPETGPDDQDRDEPGSTSTNPAGKSTDSPAEGGDNVPPKQPGSPQG